MQGEWSGGTGDVVSEHLTPLTSSAGGAFTSVLIDLDRTFDVIPPPRLSPTPIVFLMVSGFALGV